MNFMFRKLMVAFCLTVAMVATVEAQNSFSYQAVIRTAKGELVSNQEVGMQFSLIYDNQVVYSETHKVKTSQYGNVQVKVGEGQKVSGDFAKVPWSSMNVMMKIEADPQGGTNYIDLGTIQLQPAPYAMYAPAAGTVHTVQAGEPKSDSDALFEVKDKDGNVVFAVYRDGVRVFVDDSEGKPMATGFAVSGRKAAKEGEEADIFTVNAEGTQVFVSDEGKPKATGFAVSGRKAAKDGSSDLFTVGSTGTQIYIDPDNYREDKAARTGFAVSGRKAAKDSSDAKYFEINADGTRVYIDDAPDKAVRTGFAVSGRKAAKGEGKYMEINADGTRVYVDNENKAARTGFAVAGRKAAKGKAPKLFEVNSFGTQIYIDDDPDSYRDKDKAVRTGFAVSGRKAAKNSPDSNWDKYMVIDADGTHIYVDYEDAKAMQTGFAVAGRKAAKDGTQNTILNVSSIGTRAYIDDVDGKAMATGFAVSGRKAAKEGDSHILQITSNGTEMSGENLTVQDKDTDQPILTITPDDTKIYTDEFQLTNDSDSPLLTAGANNGMEIKTNLVLAGDVAQTVDADEIEDILPIQLLVQKIDTIVIADSASALDAKNGYELLKIYGNGLFAQNQYVDAEKKSVILFNAAGNPTKIQQEAAAAVIMTGAATNDAKLIVWPLKAANNLKINFGLMAAGDTSNRYVNVEAYINASAPIECLVDVKAEVDSLGTVAVEGLKVYGEKVEIAATAVEGYHFSQWADGRRSNPRTALIMHDTAFASAIFEINTYKLNTKAENGKIDIIGAQNADTTYNHGTKIELTAIAAEHYHFISWTDGETAAKRELTIKSDTAFEATFAIDSFKIAALAENGVVEGAGIYAYGTEIELVAAADTIAGYHFVNWSDGSTDNPRKLTVTDNLELTANFAINAYLLTYILDNEVYKTTTVEYGAEIEKVEVAPKTGYTFNGWEGIQTIMPKNNLTVKGSWTLNTYTITFNENNGVWAEGYKKTVSYTIEDEEIKLPTAENISLVGNTFDGWYTSSQFADGTKVTAIAKGSTGDTVFYAKWTPNESTVTVTVSPAEAGKVTGAGTYTIGTEIPLTAEATDISYEFDSWEINGQPVSSPDVTENLKITIDSDIKVVAKFKKKMFAVTVTANNDDYGTVTGSGTVSYGASAEISAAPEKGYYFIGWDNDADGNADLSDNPYTITNITEPATYTAIFAQMHNTLYVRHYVSQKPGVIGGDDENSGISENSPLYSVEKALEIFASYNSPESDYTIDADIYEESLTVPNTFNGKAASLTFTNKIFSIVSNADYRFAINTTVPVYVGKADADNKTTIEATIEAGDNTNITLRNVTAKGVTLSSSVALSLSHTAVTNPIALAQGKTIALTGSGNKATITPAAYTDETPILTSADAQLLATEAANFTVPDALSDYTKWIIDSEGKLRRTALLYFYITEYENVTSVEEDPYTTLKVAKNTTVTPPTPSREGYTLKCWHELLYDGDNYPSDLDGEAFDFSTYTVDNNYTYRTFFAEWERTLYVGGETTDSDAAQGSAENPFATIDQAINEIETDGVMDSYSIRITGEIENVQVELNDNYSDEDEDKKFSNKAKSVTFEGTTALSNGVPQDALVGVANSDKPVLKIISIVPVTIKNLKITGGTASGIEINYYEDVVVTLDNGALIAGNDKGSAYGAGAGINMEYGTLIMLPGSKVADNTGSDGAINVGYGSTLDMRGGEVSGNVTLGYYLKLSGSPVIDTVKFYSANIVLTDNLEEGASITIQPDYYQEPWYYEGYAEYETLIDVEEYSDISIADNIDYFHLVPNNDDDREWYITDEGKLSYYCMVKANNTTYKVAFNEKMEAPNSPTAPDETSEFAGWLNGETLFDFENTSITENMELTPVWVQPKSELYVNTNYEGNDSDGTAGKPFAHIQDAMRDIYLYNKSDWDYTVHVTGMDNNSATIPEDRCYYTDNEEDDEEEEGEDEDNKVVIKLAKSILIKGETDESGLKKPISIYTSAPVTLENIKFVAEGEDGCEAMAALIGHEANVTFAKGTDFNGNLKHNKDYGVIVYGKLTMANKTSIHHFGDVSYYVSAWSMEACGVCLNAENAELIMQDTASIYSCMGSNAGGIHLKQGKVTMKDHAAIGGEGKGCCSKNDGGGINIDNGELIMQDFATISYCKSKTYGGGVCMNGAGAKFTMKSADNAISNCEGAYVGGVNVGAGCKFTMENGQVINNKGVHSSGTVYTTGGVYIHAEADAKDYKPVELPGEFIMKNGSVSNNTGHGVIIYAAYKEYYLDKYNTRSDRFTVSGVFDMQGGIVSGNTNGNGVHVYASATGGNYDQHRTAAGLFKLHSAATVTDDVYLDYMYSYRESQAQVTLAGALQNELTITPEDYNTTTSLIAVADGAGTTFEDNISKLKVTPYQPLGSDIATEYNFGSDGTVYIDIAKMCDNIATMAEDATIAITGKVSESDKATWIGSIVTAIEANSGREITLDLLNMDGMTEIENSGFNNCSNLAGIILPKDITTIGNSAFSGTGIALIDIHEGAKTIGESAFANCAKLESAVIPASLETIGANAFDGCNNLKTIYFRGTTDQKSTLLEGVSDDNPLKKAQWICNSVSLYVSPNGGTNYEAGLTASKPSGAMESGIGSGAIFDKIRRNYSSTNNIIVFVSNTMTGQYTLYATDNTTDHTYGFNGKVASITFCGLHGLRNGAPIDVFDGNDMNKDVFTIKTTVPITFKNLKITNGKRGVLASGSDSSKKCNVTLGSGSLVTGNGVDTNTEYHCGVYTYCADVTLDGGKITANKGKFGGGVYLNYYGKLTMKSGSIEANEATNGGGVYVINKNVEGSSSKSTFIMQGGTISGNTATDKGNGVYYLGTFEISGSAYIDPNNDVWADNKITITGALTADGPVATITPSDYSTNTQVLEASGVTLSDWTGKFAVTTQSDGTRWEINSSDGKLKYGPLGDKNAPSAVGDIVFSDGSAVACSSDLQLNDRQKTGAVAVIYKVSGSTKYGVGLNEASLAWATSDATCLKDDAEPITEKCYDTSNGLNNRSWLDYADAGASHYPAIFWSGSSMTGGYLPSSGELSVLMSNKTTVNNSLGKLGKTTMNSEYWSSTVSSTTNAYYDGSDNTAPFTTQKKVRFIKKF